MKFIVQYKPSLLVERQLHVSVDRWVDARTIGLLHFGCENESLTFVRAEWIRDDEMDVETRWHGMPPAQRFQFRMFGGHEWPWRDIDEYYDANIELGAFAPAPRKNEDLGMEAQQER